MPSERSYSIEGVLGREPVYLSIDPPQSSLLSPSIYAPAAPGLVVALMGLWIAHRFTRSRDRRKEVSDLCADLGKAVDSAADAAIAAWIEKDPVARVSKIIDAKRKLQAAGIAATNLKRRSAYSRASSWRTLFGGPANIDVVAEISRLRRAATEDPFEDPGRGVDQERASDVAVVNAEIRAAIDQGFGELFNQR